MDRVTQLQECVDKLSELMYTGVGVLQRDAPLVACSEDQKVTCWTEEQIAKNTADSKELSKNIAKDLAETKAIIDFLIDNLPGISTTPEEQLNKLKELEEENRIEGERLQIVIREAEDLLGNIRQTLDLVLDDQYMAPEGICK